MMFKLESYIKILTISLFMLILISTNVSADIIVDKSRLPLLWSLEQTSQVSSNNKLSQYSKKLGGEILNIDNYIINANDIKIQVNVISASSVKDAENIHNKLVKLSSNSRRYQIRGAKVFEFLSTNILVIEKMKDILNFNVTEPIKYSVNFSVAPLKDVRNEMKWNKFSNLLVSYYREPENIQLKKDIIKLKDNFVFDSDFCLRTVKSDNRKYRPHYLFSNEPDNISNKKYISNFHFSHLEKKLDIPIISIKSTIPVKDFSLVESNYKLDKTDFLRQTEHWPVNDEEIVKIVRQNTNSQLSTEKKVEQLLKWINKNIKYDGQLGSRYGVKQVLEQKYGWCMDMADLLITLSRAADIPARFVMGWLVNTGGHVWVEVFIPGKGWLPVDATTSWLGVSNSYIPLVISNW